MTHRSWRILTRTLRIVATVTWAIAGVALLRGGDLDADPWWRAFVAVYGLMLLVEFGQMRAASRERRLADQADAGST